MSSPTTKNEASQTSADAPEQADPVAEARRVLAEDEEARMQACAAKIQEVLVEYGMSLEVTPSQITLVPQK